MNAAQAPSNVLRLWPGLLLVAAQWLLRFAMPILWPDTLAVGVGCGVLGGMAVLVWWLFFSRAAQAEKWGAFALIVLAMLAASRLVDRSIATGMMGLMFPIYSIPVLSLVLVGWAALTQGFSVGARRFWLIVSVLLACGGWTLLRTNGMTGGASSDFAWRWAPSLEEKLVALPLPVPVAPAVHREEAPVSMPTAEWPGFRGPGRDGVILGSRIVTDWKATPPAVLWRRPIGPGWGSFAVQGNLLFTQEQRGEDELVTCYNASSGAPVWVHKDRARFWESNAGPGPRATPTLHEGRVYTLGGTGLLNALDARDGRVIWTRNAATDLQRKIPGWGFAGSPIVVAELVIVALSGQMAAYDRSTGAARWVGPPSDGGYSSPQLVTLGGVAQVLLASEPGLTSVSPADGKVLWKHAWPGNARIVQPGLMADGDLLLEGGESTALRRLAVNHGADGWKVEERWTTKALKPYFNDFVVSEGYIYGFDGGILACVDAKDGTRKWKGGRYGHGQMVLLREAGVLLVLSEEGELALVRASAEEFSELARVSAIEGKTWNHPVVVGDRLYVRNGAEMVAFRLTKR